MTFTPREIPEKFNLTNINRSTVYHTGRLISGSWFDTSAEHRGGGGGVLALEMGRGVPPALSKPDPVAICLMAQKTPCPNFGINIFF